MVRVSKINTKTLLNIINCELFIRVGNYFKRNYAWIEWKVKVLVIQSCLTLCNAMHYGPAGFSVHGILQARMLELPFPPPGELPNPGIESGSPTLQADPLPSEPPGKSLINSREHYIYKYTQFISDLKTFNCIIKMTISSIILTSYTI